QLARKGGTFSTNPEVKPYAFYLTLYVACEKDTLRAQLTGWLKRTGVPVLVVRGFGSQSYAQVVRERTAGDPRPAVLLYVVLPGFRDCGMTLR
ncbi:hypothetical protein ACWCPL_43510, partial [Streptomyces sp. NPDC001948]